MNGNDDGVINGSDYTLIDNAYNTQGASLAAQIATPASAPSKAPPAAPDAAPVFSTTSAAVANDVPATPDSVASAIFAPDSSDPLPRKKFSVRPIQI